MAEVSGRTTVDRFIRKMLYKKGSDNSNYVQYLAIISDGIQRLNFHHLGTYRSVLLDVDTTDDTVDYPTDYVKYISLSVDDGDGKMWTFTRDDTLIITES